MIDQFRIADKNESGSLDREEMTEVLLALYRGEKISRKACLIQEDVNLYMTQFDADGSGELEFLEFVNFATNPDVLKLKLTTKQRERVILLARAMSALMADNVASPITRREKYVTNKKSIEEGMRKLVTLIERYQADANNTQSIESLLSSVIGTHLDVDIFEEKMKSILATEKHATFLDCLSLSYGTEELGLQVSPEAKADALSFVKQASEQVKIVTELFMVADVDNNGTLDLTELSLLVKAICKAQQIARPVKRIQQEVEAAMKTYDIDQSGTLDLVETILMYTSSYTDFQLIKKPNHRLVMSLVEAEALSLQHLRGAATRIQSLIKAKESRASVKQLDRDAKASAAEKIVSLARGKVKRDLVKLVEHEVDELCTLFNAADLNKDGNINEDEMVQLVRECYRKQGTARSASIVKAEVEAALKLFDSDANGKLDLGEFITMFAGSPEFVMNRCPKSKTDQEVRELLTQIGAAMSADIQKDALLAMKKNAMTDAQQNSATILQGFIVGIVEGHQTRMEILAEEQSAAALQAAMRGRADRQQVKAERPGHRRVRSCSYMETYLTLENEKIGEISCDDSDTDDTSDSSAPSSPYISPPRRTESSPGLKSSRGPSSASLPRSMSEMSLGNSAHSTMNTAESNRRKEEKKKKKLDAKRQLLRFKMAASALDVFHDAARMLSNPGSPANTPPRSPVPGTPKNRQRSPAPGTPNSNGATKRPSHARKASI